MEARQDKKVGSGGDRQDGEGCGSGGVGVARVDEDEDGRG